MPKPTVLLRRRRRMGRQGGTTMIEVLVASLVLSIGLMGLAAMQTKAIQTASGLATQQVIVQSLGAYGEAQLSSPNYSLIDAAFYCRSLWLDFTSFADPNPTDLSYLNTFLGTYTPCGNAALEVHKDYKNATPAPNSFDSFQNGKECDYIAPQTHTVTCTLPTGDAISLENLVWIR